MPLILQIVSIYHHIRRRQINLPNSGNPSLGNRVELLYSFSREPQCTQYWSFLYLFHREIVARSILATGGNNLKCATTPSCLASYHFRAIIVRDGRMLSLLVDFLREIIILDILISSKKVSVLRYLLDQDTRGGGCERKV